MIFNIKNKVVIITGAAQGIGAIIAKVFAQQGGQLILSDINKEKGQALTSELKAQNLKVKFCYADISNKSQVQFLVNHTLETYGRFDAIIHNAAFMEFDFLNKLDEQTIDQSLSTTIKAAFWLSQSALPIFKTQGRGRLLFTSSVTGPRVALPGMSNYAAAKSGLNGFIRASAVELGKYNITVNGVEPGFINTEAMALLGDKEKLNELEKQIPLGKMGRPEDIAHTMLFLASDESAYITGQTFVVDGGSTLLESAALFTD
jgi:3-oxoacyl-[acyl-carrier protein] reductase